MAVGWIACSLNRTDFLHADARISLQPRALRVSSPAFLPGAIGCAMQPNSKSVRLHGSIKVCRLGWARPADPGSGHECKSSSWLISGSPTSAQWRLWWNRMNRRIQAT